MKDKIIFVIKLIPGLTLICYLCGFIIFKTFLLQYRIIDNEIFNIRFISTGILFLIITPFLFLSSLLLKNRGNLYNSLLISFFACFTYQILFAKFDYRNEMNSILLIVLIVLFLSGMSYFVTRFYYRYKVWNENRLKFIIWITIVSYVILLMYFFGAYYFKHISLVVGGGREYHKILILKEKKDVVLKTDSLMKSDTLNVIYENQDYIYFLMDKNVHSIKRELVDGEILVK